MKKFSLAIYFVILILLCTAFIAGARILGKQGQYLAQGYMFTPAIAALLTRVFFYKPGFKDANLRIGRAKDYLLFWLISLGVTALSFFIFTLLKSISWDFTGQVFLERMAQQFAASGQKMDATLPAGITPLMMLMIFSIGGLTVFNVFPGIVTGFGEEFGHRGLMFPLLYKIKPWMGFVFGGLIWYAWHIPLILVIPQGDQTQSLLNHAALMVGSICTFTYLAFVYVKSRSVWVTSLAHISMNNSAMSFSYFVIIKDPILANIGLAITMLIVIMVLYYSRQLGIFSKYFDENRESNHFA